MRLPRPLLLAALLLAACPAAPPSTDTAADEQAIRALAESWNAAIVSHNDSLIASFYAEDGSILPPMMRKVSGRDNVRAFWTGLWGMNPSLSMMPSSITMSGDIAIEEGTYIWSITGAAGEEKETGKVLIIWRRAGNSWQVVQHMWNPDHRPTGPSA
jgi:uncharacterized protein (TIGR02246 family)